MNRTKLSIWLCMLCLVVGLTASVAVGQQRRAAVSSRVEESQRVTGTVLGVGGRFGGRTTPFSLIVNRYSSADEVAQLNSALQSGGQDELQRVLSKMRAGRIAIGNNVGVDANAIISVPVENGTKLIVLYERNINFYEIRSGSRSEDYRFGYAELFLRRRGTGEGTFIPAAKVRLRDGNTWEVEDFGVFPARLLGLQSRGGGNEAR